MEWIKIIGQVHKLWSVYQTSCLTMALTLLQCLRFRSNAERVEVCSQECINKICLMIKIIYKWCMFHIFLNTRNSAANQFFCSNKTKDTVSELPFVPQLHSSVNESNSHLYVINYSRWNCFPLLWGAILRITSLIFFFFFFLAW